MALRVNEHLLREFEEKLNTSHPEKSHIPPRIIGFGEISTVFEIDHPELKGFAFKRLPLFRKEEEAEEYRDILKEYISILNGRVGIEVIETDSVIIKRSDNRVVLYVIQKRLPSSSIGNTFMKNAKREKALEVFKEVIKELKKVHEFNEKNKEVKAGIDGQISNWAIEADEEKTRLIYLDVSTPLYRKEGREMLKAELFLKSTPPLIRAIVKRAFLQEVLDRYYDFRLVLIDLIANFFKEGLGKLIPDLVNAANELANVERIAVEEVTSYYRRDVFIWSLFLSLRKMDRFLTTKILRKRYEFILPEKIERYSTGFL